MSGFLRLRLSARKIVFFSKRCLESEASVQPRKDQVVDVAGLSEKVLKVPSKEVGPGAVKSGNYKNPEYFSYDGYSYFEAEREILKFRLPQPSSK